MENFFSVKFLFLNRYLFSDFKYFFHKRYKNNLSNEACPIFQNSGEHIADKTRVNVT